MALVSRTVLVLGYSFPKFKKLNYITFSIESSEQMKLQTCLRKKSANLKRFKRNLFFFVFFWWLFEMWCSVNLSSIQWDICRDIFRIHDFGFSIYCCHHKQKKIQQQKRCIKINIFIDINLNISYCLLTHFMNLPVQMVVWLPLNLDELWPFPMLAIQVFSWE